MYLPGSDQPPEYAPNNAIKNKKVPTGTNIKRNRFRSQDQMYFTPKIDNKAKGEKINKP